MSCGQHIFSLLLWVGKIGLRFSQNKTIILGSVRGNNNSLISLPRDGSSPGTSCCSDENLGLCVTAAVNRDSFLDQGDISILGTDLTFHNTVQPNGQVYKNAAGDEAVITYNDQTGNMFGSFKTHQDQSFALEPCQNGHVWKEFDISSFGQNVIANTTSGGVSSGQRAVIFPDLSDNVTAYTYSVMFYVSFNFYSSKCVVYKIKP